MKIRHAKKEDVGEIYQLGEKVDELRFSGKHFHEKFELVGFLKGKDNVFLVAEENGFIVGFIYARIISKDWCMLDNLVVNKKIRGNGVGSLLLEEFYRVLRKRGVDYVQVLEEIHHRKTRKFWHDKGFKEEKVFIWADKVLSPSKLNHKGRI